MDQLSLADFRTTDAVVPNRKTQVRQAHLGSVLTNEFALADVGLSAADFHALFDGALRDPADCASRSH